MGCGNEISDWDDKAVQDSLAGKNTEPDPKILEETMPEVERAIEEKAEKFIENSEKDHYENLSPDIRQEEPMATPEEIQAEREIAKEIGMNTEEISFLPVTAGLSDKEIRETVDFLHNGKIPIECWNNGDRVWKIAYIDRREPGILASTLAPTEHPLEPRSMIAEPIKIYQNEKGERPTREERNLKIAHEIWHRNEPEFMEILAYSSEKWEKACQAQLQKGPVSEYAVKDYKEGRIPKESLPYHPEFQAEHYKHWATDTPGLCQEMYNFFDQHFPQK